MHKSDDGLRVLPEARDAYRFLSPYGRALAMLCPVLRSDDDKQDGNDLERSQALQRS